MWYPAARPPRLILRRAQPTAEERGMGTEEEEEEEVARFFGRPSFRSRLRDPDRNGLPQLHRRRRRVVMMITTIMMMVMELGRQMMRHERERERVGEG